MATASLPAEFRELEDLIGEWALPDELSRNLKRVNSNMEEIRRFYDRMMQSVEAALRYLEPRPLSALTPPEENLYRLCLMLAEVGNAVDYYGVPYPIGGAGGRGYDQMRLGRYEMHFGREACERVTIAHGLDAARLWD